MNEPNEPRGELDKRKADDAESAQWMRLAGIGFEFIVAVLLVGAIGWLFDNWFDTTPWLLITGVGLGFALGMWQLIRAARRVFHD